MTTETTQALECDDTGDSCPVHAEPTTTQATAPMTAEQIAARLTEIAPLSTDGTSPVAAEDLARATAVSAQRRWTRNLSGWFDLGDRAFSESIGTMCSEFAALHSLMALTAADPAKAAEAATQIRDAWDDGGMIGELLYQHAQALGIDTAEVDCLEYAWQALPEVQATRKPSAAPQSPADASQRIALDHVRAALARLASGVPVTPDADPWAELGARRKYAEQMAGDIASMLGEGQ